jgi:hypothetical protein
MPHCGPRRKTRVIVTRNHLQCPLRVVLLVVGTLVVLIVVMTLLVLLVGVMPNPRLLDCHLYL